MQLPGFEGYDCYVMTTDPQTDANQVLKRLSEMGIKSKLLDGRRCVLASMRLQPLPFETLGRGRTIDQVIFASIGRDRIKCLRPRALFQLPILNIASCRDSTAIEARIRLAWREYIGQLKEAASWLESIGVGVETMEEDSILSFTIEGQVRRTRATMIDPRRIILPTDDQLSGITLERPEDRTFFFDRTIRTSVELEIAVCTRLDDRQLTICRETAFFDSASILRSAPRQTHRGLDAESPVTH
jgi:hypothetical protein